MITFFHRVLHRILPHRHLSKEDEWDNLKCFDFLGEDSLENDQFMLKAFLRDRALSSVKEQINVGKKKGEVELTLLQPLSSTQTIIPFTCLSGVFEESMWGTVAAASLEVWSCCWFCLLRFFVPFELPKIQNTECFKQIFKSFSDRQWIAKMSGPVEGLLYGICQWPETCIYW